MKAELNSIVSKEISPNGMFAGRLEYVRYLRKETKRKWQVSNNAQLVKKDKPSGRVEDEINQLDAKILVLEKEARTLNKLIREAETKIAESAIKQASHPRNRLTGKFKYGKLWMMGGREVTQTDKGENIFVDDGSNVVDYIEKEKAKRRERWQKKRQGGVQG